MVFVNERGKATEEIVDSIRDLYSLKLTLPLGNPSLKLVHTNQFIFTELPTGVFDLVNLNEISRALNSKYSRFSGYELNRWYIEGCTITNDKSNFTMELDLNPFASSFTKYTQEMRDIEKTYEDTFNKNNNNVNSTTNKNKTTVKSTSIGIKLYNVKGFKKSDQEYIKKVVTDALKKANYPKTQFKRAKAIHEHYKANHVYNRYSDMPKMCKYGFQGCWKRQKHNCGDGSATLKAMFQCIGLKPDIYLGHNHFWIKVKIDGKTYYCDQAGQEGSRNTRVIGTKGNNSNVWHGTSGGSVHNNYC